MNNVFTNFKRKISLEKMASLPPSKCAEGFVAGYASSPWLLGKGFGLHGPKPYQQLYNKWTREMSVKLLSPYFREEQVDLVTVMIQSLRDRNAESKNHQGVLSDMISPILQRLAISFSSSGRDWTWMDVGATSDRQEAAAAKPGPDSLCVC